MSNTPAVARALELRSAALDEYNRTHALQHRGGVVTPGVWLAVARDLSEAATAVAALPNSTADSVQFIADRAIDAAHEAEYCARRQAAGVSAIDMARVIDVQPGPAGIVEVAS